MPIGCWDGSAGHSMRDVGCWDGTTGHAIKSIGCWDGTTGHPIWNHEEPGPGPGPSEQTETLKVSGLQDNVWHYKTISVGNYSKVTVLNFVSAQSYGRAATYLAVYRNGWLHYTLRDMTRTYTGTGFSDNANSPPRDMYDGLQPGDEIKLAFQASYDSSVSGQGDSTATATIKLSK